MNIDFFKVLHLTFLKCNHIMNMVMIMYEREAVDTSTKTAEEVKEIIEKEG